MNPSTMICPKCGAKQPTASTCLSCGIVIRRYLQQHAQSDENTSSSHSPTQSNPQRMRSSAAKDPKIDWTPAVKVNMASFQRRLVKVNSQCMQLQPSRGWFAFALLVFVFGSIFLASVYLIWEQMGPAAKSTPGIITTIIVGGGGLGVIAWGLGKGFFNTMVFDKRQGSFRKTFPKQMVELRQINALQLLSKDIEQNQRSKTHVIGREHELNLILKRGKRIHLATYRDLDQLRKDAETLSRFLGKPVRDGAY